MERSASGTVVSSTALSYPSPSARRPGRTPMRLMARSGSCTLLAPEPKQAQHEEVSSSRLHLRRSLDLGSLAGSEPSSGISLASAASAPLESAMRTSTAAAAGPTLLGVPVVAYQPPKELAFNRRAQQKAMEHRKKPAAAKQQAALDANTAFLLRRAQRVAQERSSLPLATQGVSSAFANA